MLGDALPRLTNRRIVTSGFVVGTVAAIALYFAFPLGAPSGKQLPGVPSEDVPGADVPALQAGAGASQSPSSSSDAVTSGGDKKVLGVQVLMAPKSINATCLKDVTTPIMNWIAGVPDGTAIAFRPKGCYRIDGTIYLDGRKGLVIDGNGATFRATYSSVRTRAHWRLHYTDGITLKNMTIEGVNTSWTYSKYLEAQHGVWVSGSRKTTISNITVRKVYGDGVTISRGGHGPGTARPSQDVVVADSTFDSIGRQGIAVTTAVHVTLTRNRFDKVRRTVFDLEPDAPTQIVDDVVISKNRTGLYMHFFVASGGPGCGVNNIVIRDNDSDGGGIGIITRKKFACRKSGYLVENNTFRVKVGVTWDAWATFTGVDNITVRGNKILTDRHMPGVRFDGAGGKLLVYGNVFSGACEVYIYTGEGNGPVTAYDNTYKGCEMPTRS